jgi:hypothetical protein
LDGLQKSQKSEGEGRGDCFETNKSQEMLLVAVLDSAIRCIWQMTA